MLKVLLDTNILVKFAFIYLKKDKNLIIPKHLKKFNKLLELYEKSKFINIMPNWSKLELRDVLMKLKLIEVYFLDGYTSDEFHNAKEEGLKLNKENIKGVNEIIFDIWKFSNRTTKEMDMRKVEKFTKKDFSCMDIILLYQAELNNCNYFVTEDKKLRMDKELEKSFNVKICCVNEFINKFK